MQTATTTSPQINLDYLAAKYARKMAQEMVGQDYGRRDDGSPGGQVKADQARNTIQKTLGILQESGLYAVIVWLLSRSGSVTGAQETWRRNCSNAEKLCSLTVLSNLFQLANTPQLGSTGIALPERMEINAWTINPQQNKESILEHFSETIIGDLDRLIFTRHLYEQTLVYALFITKALG